MMGKLGRKGVKKGREYIRYRCQQNEDTGYVSCRPNTHLERKLMDALMSAIASHAQNDKLLSEMLAQQDHRGKAELRKERETILDALSKMQERRRRQWLAYEKGTISLEEFAKSRLALKEEEEELEGSLGRVEAALTRRVTKDTLKNELSRLAASWRSLERPSLKAALANLIETIAVYDDGRMEITYQL